MQRENHQSAAPHAPPAAWHTEHLGAAWFRLHQKSRPADSPKMAAHIQSIELFPVPSHPAAPESVSAASLAHDHTYSKDKDQSDFFLLLRIASSLNKETSSGGAAATY